ncbi:flavin reductase family protein [Aurantiacibacter rhizosphaerae]|uniref:Flavin reductase n=1 Tax=Aurantiacibacter rhizosphaerae TaxID=2691582 RepID=A0A844XDP0_9SPHN|nr:flavin reductase family protein [Aurantiacibacter rhizosphaerae]MWV28671.1 flavin reductase [Aurantiacibacter rhizosphaerae]
MKTIETDLFRSAMCRLASAVTLITTDGPAGRRGLVATAVTSITDDPPNILVCVNKSARSNAMIKQNGAFAVNVLNEGQEGLVGAFMSKSGDDPFDKSDVWTSLETGAPILKESLASLDCVLDQIINIGTHSLFVGHVTEVRIGTQSSALVYFDRAFCSVAAK